MINRRDSLRGTVGRLQRLYSQQRARRAQLFPAATPIDAREGSSGTCWLCCEFVGVDSASGIAHRLYGEYPLCFPCLRDLLLSIIIPPLDRHFAESDAATERAVTGVAQASPSGSPVTKHAPTITRDSWECPRCTPTVRMSSFASQCEHCNLQRPSIECPRCRHDAFMTKACRSAEGKDHSTWFCPNDECTAINFDEAVECRLCHRPRTWFCDACGLENQWSEDVLAECEACGGSGRLNSLRSFINKSEVLALGIDANEAAEEQAQARRYAEHQQRLRDRVEAAGLLPILIDDDGNCLFRALAFQLVRDDTLHGVVRRMVCDYMEANCDTYVSYIGEDRFPRYLARMRQDRCWGDELTVQAAALLFFATIHVVTSEPVRWHLKYKPSATEKPSRHLFLAYCSPVHYYCFIAPGTGLVPHAALDRELDAAGLRQLATPPSSPHHSHSHSSSSIRGASSSSLSMSLPSAMMPAAYATTAAPLRSSASARLEGSPQHALSATGSASHPGFGSPAFLTPTALSSPSFSSGHQTSASASGSGGRVPIVAVPSGPAPIPFAGVALLRHPVVVVVRLIAGGHPPLYWAVSGSAGSPVLNPGGASGSSAAALSHSAVGAASSPVVATWQATRFYLHPRNDGRRPVDPATRRDASVVPFALQCVSTGRFVRPGAALPTRSVRRALEVAPLSGDGAPFFMTGDDVGGSVAFASGWDCPRVVCGQGEGEGADELFCVASAQAAADVRGKRTIGLHVLFAGKQERLCTKCKQWYDVEDASVSLLNCSHRNVCDDAAVLLLSGYYT